MDALIQWATQIVVFLLLAMVIDLLIPANVMKKYIKLVVGLILVLIFLKPLFFLFDINIEEALETSFQQLSQAESNPESMENSIEIQKNEIQASQSAYILEETEVQLIDEVKTQVYEGYQAEISDIHFQFTKEQELTYESLEEVIVYLREKENGEGEVNTVEKIEINTESEATDENQPEIKEIESLLHDVWGIDKKKLTIVWEGGTP